MPRIRPCASLKGAITYAAIVADYERNHRRALRVELEWFAEARPWTARIRRVALAEGRNNKRLSHQWRLLTHVIPTATAQLLSAQRVLARASTFEDLLLAVENSIGTIPGAGPLYIYDTALRLGYADRCPDRVYLHAGARKGARRLLRGVVGPSVPFSRFPAEFRGLEPYEIENLLCLYEECLPAKGLSA